MSLCTAVSARSRATARNATWSVADQVVSGLSNVVLAIAAARVGTPEQFGVLSAAIVAVTALLSISRVALGNSVAMSARHARDDVRKMSGYAGGLLIFLAPALAAFVAGVAWISGATASTGVAALMGVAAPIVLMQDLLRFEASTLGRSGWAFLADSAWLVVMAAVILAMDLVETPVNLVTVTAAWALGAFVALGILALALRTPPRLAGLTKWVKAQGSFLVNSAGGTAAVSAANVGRVSLIGAAVGPVVVGSLAAGQLLMTPLNLLVALLPFAVTPVIARRARGSSALRPYSVVALASCLAGLAWGAICATVPDAIGQAVLGEVWEPAISLLAPMVLLSISVLVTASAASLLLFMQRSKSYAVVSMVVALGSLLGTSVSLRLEGQVEVLAWTQTAVVVLGAGLSWALALRADRRLADIGAR